MKVDIRIKVLYITRPWNDRKYHPRVFVNRELYWQGPPQKAIDKAYLMCLNQLQTIDEDNENDSR
jgi:hypothetical protein